MLEKKYDYQPVKKCFLTVRHCCYEKYTCQSAIDKLNLSLTMKITHVKKTL